MTAREAPDPGGAGAGRHSAGAERTTDAAPPFLLPGEHFAAALVFLLAGGILLAWRSPALAAGAFSDPWVIAATHLVTLGWISTTIMGALYQFLPVALGAEVRWQPLAHGTFGLWVAGVAAFVAGVASGAGGILMAGALLTGIAAILLAVNVGATLLDAPRRDLTAWCVTGAVAFLLGAWFMGFLLAVNLDSGLLGASRFAVLAVHLHIAAGGWVLLTMIGVAHRLLPMFLLSHGVSTGPEKVAAAAVALSATALLLSEHVLPVSTVRPALALMGAGAMAFLVQAGLHYRNRRRPDLDPGMRLVAGALFLLAGAVGLGGAILLAGGAGPRLYTAYGVLLVPGGLALFVAGHLYRILPFLTWFHRFGPVASRQEVPRVAELFDHRIATGAGLLLVGGVVLMAGGVLGGQEVLTRAGALAFAGGAGVEAAQMLGVSRRRPA